MREVRERDWRKCVSCGGIGTVIDHGSNMERPCSMCEKAKYRQWVVERQPATRSLATLDDLGRCCGRKPLLYKRPTPHLCCLKCSAEIDPSTGRQVANWAWEPDGDSFVATYPTSDYALLRAKEQETRG